MLSSCTISNYTKVQIGVGPLSNLIVSMNPIMLFPIDCHDIIAWRKLSENSVAAGNVQLSLFEYNKFTAGAFLISLARDSLTTNIEGTLFFSDFRLDTKITLIDVFMSDVRQTCVSFVQTIHSFKKTDEPLHSIAAKMQFCTQNRILNSFQVS